eukprot:47399_1
MPTTVPIISNSTTADPTTSNPTTSFPTTLSPTAVTPTISTLNPTEFSATILNTTQYGERDGDSGEIGVDTTIYGNKWDEHNTLSNTNASILMVFYIVAAMVICICIIGIFILIKVKKKQTSSKHKEIASQSPTAQNNLSNTFANTCEVISEEPQYLNNHVTAGGAIQTYDINLNENQNGDHEGNPDENVETDEEIIEMCNMVTKGGENQVHNMVNKDDNIGSEAMSPLSIASLSIQSDYNIMNDNFTLTVTKGNIQPDEFIVEDDEHQTKGFIASEHNTVISEKEECVTKGNEYEDNDIVDI